MPTNYTRMTTPALISARSAKRREQAQYRLDNWDMSPKNIKRLTAYVESFDAKKATPKAKTGKAAPAKAVVAQAEAVSADLKAEANRVWKAVFEQAPDGKRKRAAGKAFALVMNGHDADEVLANIDLVLSL